MTKRIYTEEEKAIILEEVRTVKKISLVAKKHGIPTTTIHTWLKKSNLNEKEQEISKEKYKKLQKKLSSAELENKILKDLLKKTVQIWDAD